MGTIESKRMNFKGTVNCFHCSFTDVFLLSTLVDNLYVLRLGMTLALNADIHARTELDNLCILDVSHTKCGLGSSWNDAAPMFSL